MFGRACLGIVSLLAAMIVTFVLPNPAHACSCVQRFAAPQAAEHSALVFIGRIVDADPPPPPPGASGSGEIIDYTLDVSVVFKGSVGRVETINSQVDMGGNCGLTFQVGQELGLALDPADQFRVDLCSSSVYDPAELFDAAVELGLVPLEPVPRDAATLDAAVEPVVPVTAADSPGQKRENRAAQAPEGGASVTVDRGDNPAFPVGWVLAGVLAVALVLGIALAGRRRSLKASL